MVDEDATDVGAADGDATDVGAADGDATDVGAADEDAPDVGTVDKDATDVGDADEDATDVGDTDEVVGFDVEASLAAAREAVGDERVLLCVAYDDTDFRTVYVDERIDALYPDTDRRHEHFGQIHSYVHLDFTERELFRELFLQPDGIRAFVTYMGNLIAVRVVTDVEGIFISLAPGTPVTELVDAVEDVLRG